MRIGCKAFAKRLLDKCDCKEDCYRGIEIEEIESDLKQCFKDNPEYNSNNYPIHDIAICLREIGDAVPVPPPKKYCMIFDGGDFVDGVHFDDLEAAKGDALDTLMLWMSECCHKYKMGRDINVWTEKQIEEWDMLIYNCGCCVNEYNPKTKEYDIQVWGPSYDDEKNIGWMDYEELVKLYKED